MNTNTNLSAITTYTLVVGIDVAKNAHVARVIDHQGTELYERINFQNSREGFCSFIKEIERLKTLHNKLDIIIGLEPTGVYGHTLISFLQDGGYHVVYVLGMQVKRAKELEDNSPSKNDFKDAKVIAKLVKDGYYRKVRTFTKKITELKEATRYAYQITKKQTRVKCQLEACMTEYFPEFTEAFGDVTRKTAMATLHLFPLPDQINALTAEQIVSAWRSSGVLRGIGLLKARQLKVFAKDTIGLEVTESVRLKIRSIMDEYDFLKAKEKEIWKRIESIVEMNADYHKIMSIPHMTMRLSAYLLAEVGDFRDFKHPQQLVRLAGFNLMERSSGGSRGQSQITKRGRTLLRRVLYFIVLEQLKNAAPGWHQLHNYYTTRKERPLKKMQSVIALCCKFLRVVWGMIKNNTPYDPDMLIRKGVLSKAA
jgi:transposase